MTILYVYKLETLASTYVLNQLAKVFIGNQNMKQIWCFTD